MNGAFAVIIINRDYSVCDGCGKEADPTEPTHGRVLGYGADHSQPGCGRRYIAVGTDYDPEPLMREAAARLQPDLPWVGLRYRTKERA